MEKKEKFRVGELCLYYYIPVVILEITYKSKQINKSVKEEYYSCLCLFYNSADNVPVGSLRKLNIV
jgi:hypothetical protein